jgi:hypothetical protein
MCIIASCTWDCQLITGLCRLQTIQGSNYIYKGTVTKDGQEAVCALKCAVFGSDQLARNVLELVAFHSVTKVRHADTLTIG